MSETTVIKSFLVALGFKSDEAALAKFEGGINKATTSVLKLATAVSASALAVAIGVERFASNLEALYFASVRTGASASNLKAFARAAQDFGASASEAQGSVEGFARFLRNNPGGEGLLESLGIVTRDPKTGQMRDTADVLVELGRKFAQMPTYLANQYAGMFGISDNTMLALRNGDFARDFEKIGKTFNQAGFDKAAADAHKFEMQVRTLKDNLWQFGIAAEEALMRHFGASLKDIIPWIEAHGPAIKKKIADGITAILEAIDKAKPFFLWLFNQLVKLDDITGGWSTKLLGILALLKLVGGTGIVTGILGLAGAFVRLGAGLAGLAAGAAGAGMFGLGGLLAAIGGGVGVGWGLDKLFPDNPLAKLGDKIGNGLYDFFHRDELAMQSLTGFGWSREQAAGIVSRLSHESNLFPHKVGDDGEAEGIAQWHKDRLKPFKSVTGKDFADSDLQDQMKFLNWELRNGTDAGAREAGMLIGATDNSTDSYDYFTKFAERPKRLDDDPKGHDRAVNLSAQTVVHIDGSRDAQATAEAVKQAQVGTVAEMTRNVQNAMVN